MYLFKCKYHIFLECPKRWKIIAKNACAHFNLERTLTIMLGNFQNIISSILSNCKSWWEIWSNEMKVSNQVKLFITLNIQNENHLLGARACSRTVMTFYIKIWIKMHQSIVISLSDVKLSKQVKFYRIFDILKRCNDSLMRRARVYLRVRAHYHDSKYQKIAFQMTKLSWNNW